MRGEDDRGAVGVDTFHQAPEQPSREDVKVRGRLVEDEDLRVVDERARDIEALLHAGGERAGDGVLRREQAHDIKHRHEVLLEEHVRQVVQGAEVEQVLPHRELVVEGRTLGGETEEALRALAVPEDGEIVFTSCSIAF